jgi:UDP-2-acetamido-3-amino-2,3-dideoxy-glucuronate N-acetyltransferase
MNAVVHPIQGSGYFAHSHALVESTEIGEGTRVWAFAHVMGGARVGPGCNIGEHAYIESGSVLGNNVTVKNGVSVWDGVTVEDNVFLGPNCVLTNDYNPRAYLKKTGESLSRTVIHANATIGANATILCGLEVGRYAFIGAGAVILRTVPDFALMVGNPARQVGWMCVCAQRLPFSVKLLSEDKLSCPECGCSFTRSSDGRLELLANAKESR